MTEYIINLEEPYDKSLEELAKKQAKTPEEWIEYRVKYHLVRNVLRSLETVDKR